MKTTLITGANRGLGLEFAKQYASAGWRVHACCRCPEEAQALGTLASTSNNDVLVHRLDVADFPQMGALAAHLQGEAIDLLINNAGVYPDRNSRGLGDIDYNGWAHAFRINTMAPLRMAEAFLEHLARSGDRKVALITSKMGSLDDNSSGGCYAYRSSKAALNMVAKSLAIDLAPRGILTALLHPGWVQTDMGGPDAWITPEQSVTGMRRVIDRMTAADSGKFYAYDGQLIPW